MYDIGFQFKNIPDFLNGIVDAAMFVVGPIIVVMIIYAGFLFVTARGNAAQVERARFMILWSVVGAGVMIGAKVISEAINATVRTL